VIEVVGFPQNRLYGDNIVSEFATTFNTLLKSNKFSRTLQKF